MLAHITFWVRLHPDLLADSDDPKNDVVEFSFGAETIVFPEILEIGGEDDLLEVMFIGEIGLEKDGLEGGEAWGEQGVHGLVGGVVGIWVTGGEGEFGH